MEYESKNNTYKIKMYDNQQYCLMDNLLQCLIGILFYLLLYSFIKRWFFNSNKVFKDSKQSNHVEKHQIWNYVIINDTSKNSNFMLIYIKTSS